METNSENRWLTQDNQEFIEEYIDMADNVLVERQTTIQIMLDLIHYQFGEVRGLDIADFGCGSGALTEKISKKFPHNNFYLVDGSEQMLSKAKQAFGNGNFFYQHSSFEEYLRSDAKPQCFDVVCSAFAIHHLDHPDKTKLFSKLYRELRFGGVFINIDTALPASKLTEHWQFRMWKDWMNRKLIESGQQQEAGRYDDMPRRYKRMDENKPSTLMSQIRALEDVGFRDVDCYYKHGLFTVIGAVK